MAPKFAFPTDHLGFGRRGLRWLRLRWVLGALTAWVTLAPAGVELASFCNPGASLWRSLSLASCSSRSSSRQRLRAEDCAASKAAAQWLEQERSKSAVLLIVESANAAAQDIKAALKEACVRYDVLELDQLGPTMSSAVLDQLAVHGRKSGMPFLFVGGDLLPENFRDEGKKWLQQACFKAGAQFMEPPAGTNMTWSMPVRRGGRWLPPKGINGRRFYQDEANTAKTEDEHADAARILWTQMAVSPGSGATHIRGRISNPGMRLLRQDARIDTPEAWERLQRLGKPWEPLGMVDYMQKADNIFEDDAGTIPKRRHRELMESTEQDPFKLGLPKELVGWIHTLGRKRLREELELRQCHHKVVSCVDAQGLRDALIETIQEEWKYSPSGLGVVPGVVQELDAEQLRVELDADTDVPLLVAFVNRRSSTFLRIRNEIAAAAVKLHREIRIVIVDGAEHPEVSSTHGVWRFPLLAWYQSRNGQEIGREAGILPRSSIIERTRLLLQLKELPESSEAAALLAQAGPASRKFRRDHFQKESPEKWSTVKGTAQAARGFWG